MANTPWTPPDIVTKTEARFARALPIYSDVMTVLRVHAHHDPTLKVETALVALIDAALDLASASGLLWTADYDLVAALRTQVDVLEKRRASEPAAPVISELAAVLRARPMAPAPPASD